jgi:hypothetical protein
MDKAWNEADWCLCFDDCSNKYAVTVTVCTHHQGMNVSMICALFYAFYAWWFHFPL